MTSSDAPNPYQSPATVEHRGAVYGEAARRRVGGFLYREIELSGRLSGVLRYNGWWFIQRIHLEHRLLWYKISWLRLERLIDFAMPDALGQPVAATIQIEFDSRLKFRRFQVLADGESVYDEIV